MNKKSKTNGSKMAELGQHIIGEFYGCKKEAISNDKEIEKIMLGAANAAKATIVGSEFHYFKPYGVSGVVIIKESHLAIHTWPEYGYAAIDLYTCGKIDTNKAFLYLKNAFSPLKIKKTKLLRGKMSTVLRNSRKNEKRK